jgi:hypothetical protein
MQPLIFLDHDSYNRFSRQQVRLTVQRAVRLLKKHQSAFVYDTEIQTTPYR